MRETIERVLGATQDITRAEIHSEGRIVFISFHHANPDDVTKMAFDAEQGREFALGLFRACDLITSVSPAVEADA